MTPRHDLSVEFLQRWLPGGPWVLTAISVDKKGIETRTFRDPAAVLAFLDQHGDRNHYFSVNPCLRDMTSKAARTDIKEMTWLHCDVDPRAGENLAAEQQRILTLLRNPPQGIPQPTVIVFSGGGCSAYWKLLEPREINGVEALAEDAKRYNQSLEFALGGDNCHNVDRIMRLPGTINWPDERKRKKGRTPTLAEVIEWDESRVYPLSQFAQAPTVQLDSSGFSHRTQIQVSGNVASINDINDLVGISDLAKVVAVQGTDPDDPTRFPSRSEALWFFLCDCVRADITDDVMYSVCTDADFGISASVREKGRGMDGYIRRQIERARLRAINPHLLEMNDKYAVVTFGGKQRVIYESWDEILERFRLIKMTFEDFRNKYMNRRVQIGTDAQGNPRYCPLGKWWLEHEKRRQFEKVTFAPGRETTDAYNMWRGFAFEPVAGERHQPLLDHILVNACAHDEMAYHYVLNWMARAVQMPDQPGQTAIVLRGDQGVGKGFLARAFGKLFGRHFVHVSNAQHLTGNFNAHLRDCVVLFADEAFYAGDKRHASVLKTLVTEPSIMVEPKGVDTEMAANCLHVMMASNEEWVVPAGFKERRFCVLDVGEKHRQDGAYFGRIAESLRTGGYANLLHFLLSRDISRFNVQDLPQTEALRDQKVHSLDPVQAWWFSKLEDGKLLVEHDGWKANVLVEELTADFLEYVRQWGLNNRRSSATRLGQFLRRACPEGCLRKWQSREAAVLGDRMIQRPYYYTFPDLTTMREHWDTHFGGPYVWPAVEPPEGPKENSPF